MGKLDGKVAVITGGASGIGEATVRLFIAEGALVVIADQQEARGNWLAEETGAVFVHTDVSREADVKRAVETAVERFGRLDCMFNNAGIPGTLDSIDDLTVDQFDTCANVLLKGVFLGIKHAGAVMRRQGTGSIINTGSVAGLRTGHAGHFYSTFKAAVIHLTHSVAMELGEVGVRVNSICPGGIATPIFGRAFGLPNEAAEQSVELVKLALKDRQAIKRSGLPIDIARAALWLASDDSSFVNGHELVVDGGLIPGQSWSQTKQTLAHFAGAIQSAMS